VTVPAGRFSIAFDAASALEWDPVWTRIDSTPNLLTSWTVDRGRMFELDRTDAARATVQITDPDGLLDPTNAAGPYWGLLEPLLPAVICRRDPVAAEWQQRFRGWISDFDYEYDPSGRLGRLTLELTDIFELLGAVEMYPTEFGDDPTAAVPPVPDAADQIWYEAEAVQDRINSALFSSHVPAGFSMVFSGNVTVQRASFSPGQTPLEVIAEACDAELPTCANVFTDRTGRIVFHGRVAKWDPADVIAGIGPPYDWSFHHWKAGDGATVAAVPGTVAQMRRFAFNRGLSKIINSAVATPADPDGVYTKAELDAQLVKDDVSIGRYGIRSWSAQNLLTQSDLADGANALTATRRMAEFMVANYSQPINRVTVCELRSMQPSWVGAGYTWQLMSRCDIGDMVDVTVHSDTGAGFTNVECFIEGIHETSRPAGPDYDDDTVNLDLSPRPVDTSMYP
jgi:hypothetical protein